MIGMRADMSARTEASKEISPPCRLAAALKQTYGARSTADEGTYNVGQHNRVSD
jgi:hypothetical protein